MPLAAICSGPSTSTVTASCAAAISSARAARKLGRGDVGRSALQVAGAVLGLGVDARRLGRCGDAPPAPAASATRCPAAADRRPRLALEAVEAVGAEDRAGDQRPRPRRPSSMSVSGSAQASEPRLQPRRLLRRQRGGDAQALGVDVLALAEADDEQRGSSPGCSSSQLLEAALGVGRRRAARRARPAAPRPRRGRRPPARPRLPAARSGGPRPSSGASLCGRPCRYRHRPDPAPARSDPTTTQKKGSRCPAQ